MQYIIGRILGTGGARTDAYAGFQGQAAHLRPSSRRPLPPAGRGSFSLRVIVRGRLFYPPPRSLKRSNGVEPNSPAADDNLIVHGDNLHALKALLPRYAGRVDCIYIDPPYNTGNEGWTYNDNVNSPLMREWLRANGPVDGEDLERHDKWLCMMWPRLQLHKELLSDDGAIFVSIDDNEQHHLRMLMDEIFGVENFIACVAVISNLSGSSDQFGFAGAHEYCLVYAQNRDLVKLGRFPIDADALDKWEMDEIGYYRSEQLRRGSLTFSESLHYPIFVGPDGSIEITNDDAPPQTNGPFTAVLPFMNNGAKGIWRWSKNRIRENPGDVFAERRDDGNVMVYSKQRPKLGDIPTEKPKTVFYKPEYGSRAGGQALSQALPELASGFPYPKAPALITDLLRIGATSPDSIILDSFAGSGTTAHAVLALNKEDGGNRRFILVECEDYADSITAERVRRVIKGVPDARDAALREGLGGSFAYCELGDPIDEEGMLTAESLPSRAALAAYLLHVSSGLSSDGAALADEGADEDAPFYRGETTDYYLLYRPDLEWLRGGEGMLSEGRARRIADAIAPLGRKAVVFGPGKYMGQRDLTRMGITFCQLPYEIYRPAG